MNTLHARFQLNTSKCERNNKSHSNPEGTCELAHGGVLGFKITAQFSTQHRRNTNSNLICMTSI